MKAEYISFGTYLTVYVRTTIVYIRKKVLVTLTLDMVKQGTYFVKF